PYRIRLTRPPASRPGSEGSATAPAPAQPSTFSAEGMFRVTSYHLERVRLTIDLPKSVYLRGEEIKGKVTARYYYGEPLAKRRIRFGWNDEVGEEKETDGQGEF